MIANAVFVSSLVCLALSMYLLSELAFLAPYRDLILRTHAYEITCFSALVFLNVFALSYAISRKVFLKDTGRKLAHIEKQLRTGSSISEELSEHLPD